MLDREFDYKLNKILCEKAKKYQHRGVIGIDLAGPQRDKFKLNDLFDIYLDAKKTGWELPLILAKRAIWAK